MPSKMVTDREKVDEALVAALATHREKVLEGLQQRLGPWLPEGVDGNFLSNFFTPFYDALSGLIATHKEKLTEADRRAQAERLADRLTRLRRDAVTAELRQLLLTLRLVSKAVFGSDDGIVLLQLEGRLRPDPKIVHRATLDVLGRLRDPDLELPELDVPGVEVQVSDWVARLEPLAAELGSLLEKVDRDRQETGGITVDKTETIEEHDREVGLTRRFVLVLLHLADQSALADVVRRAIRTRARRSDVKALQDAAQPTVAESEAPAESSEPPMEVAFGHPAPRLVRR